MVLVFYIFYFECTSPICRALSEYLGRENMLAVICKSRAWVETFEQYDHSGNIVT